MEVPSPPIRNTSTCPTLLSSLLICRLNELGLEALGVWSARVMAHLGDGTPLPSASANRLVVAGPYRFVRNPMAVAGIVQAIGMGLLASS